eukprot:35179_1
MLMRETDEMKETKQIIQIQLQPKANSSNHEDHTPIADVSKCVESKSSYSNIKSKQFAKLFMFNLLQSFADGAMGLLMINYIPLYFGGCLISNDLDFVEADCKENYRKYTTYTYITFSIGIFIQFVFAAFIGRLMDSFGRKLFLIIPTSIILVNQIISCFYFDIYVYTIFNVLSAVVNTGTSIKSMVSDTIKLETRNSAYAVLAVGSGISGLIGGVIAMLLPSAYGYYIIFYICAATNGLLCIYILTIMNETIDINNNRRVWHKIEIRNPFKPVLDARKNKLLWWICVSSVAIYLGFGTSGVILEFLSEETGLSGDKLTQLVFVAGIISIVSGALSNVVLLPLLQRCMNDINIMILSLLFLIIAFIIFGSVSFAPTNAVMIPIYIGFVFVGICSIFSPVQSGMISKVVHKQYQGTAFGVLNAYIQIALIISFITTGFLYAFLVVINMEYIVFIFSIFCAIVGVILTCVPLRKEFNTSNTGRIRLDTVILSWLRNVLIFSPTYLYNFYSLRIERHDVPVKLIPTQ